ncbi:MAG: 30S ribosomal protein THX [Planctomycetes bacterium]|nr:30S ribosomal protein THX [Planctomycetota bacterium]
MGRGDPRSRRSKVCRGTHGKTRLTVKNKRRRKKKDEKK